MLRHAYLVEKNEIIRLSKDCGFEHRVERRLQSKRAFHDGQVIVYITGGIIKGFSTVSNSLVGRIAGTNDSYIDFFGVGPDYRSGIVAHRLAVFTLAHCLTPWTFLNCANDNVQINKIADHFGFTPIRRNAFGFSHERYNPNFDPKNTRP